MKPIHKFNNGRGATICGKCSVIISIGLTEDLYCEKCKIKEHVSYINDNIEEFDKAIELSKQETVEEYYLPLIKNMLEYNNNALAIRLMEKYYHTKKEQDETRNT